VSRAEERVIATAAVLGVGTEVACAVVLRHHATLLTGTVATAHDVLSCLKPARVDVDVTVLIEHRLCLHLEILDKNVLLFHCSELIAREVFEKGAYIIADAQLIPSTSTQVKTYCSSAPLPEAST